MAEQIPAADPESPHPVSLRDDDAPAAAPARAPRNRLALYLAGIAVAAVFLLACVLVTPLGNFGAESGGLTDDEVRAIVAEAVATELAARPVDAAGAGMSGADVQALVDQAVATQVAQLRPTNTPIPPTPTVIPPGVAEDDDPYQGPDDAPVVIVEFSDFQCSFCGRFYNDTLSRILEEYPDEVKFVYRDFPIFGEDSLNAAMAAQCAGEEDAFWDYHDRLFDRLVRQEAAPLSVETLTGYAEELELDVDAFTECLSSQRYFDEVLADFQAAEEYGLRGTPGFVINGVVYTIGAQPFEVFQGIIEGELARQAGT